MGVLDALAKFIAELVGSGAKAAGDELRGSAREAGRNAVKGAVRGVGGAGKEAVSGKKKKGRKK